MNGMNRLRFQERLIDPRSPERHPRRAAYALPTFFTAGNLFLGFYAMMESFRGTMLIATAADTANCRRVGEVELRIDGGSQGPSSSIDGRLRCELRLNKSLLKDCVNHGGERFHLRSVGA